MISPERLNELLVSHVRWVVLVHIDLFEDDSALDVELFLPERRPLHHLGEDLHACGKVDVSHSDPVAGVFL